MIKLSIVLPCYNEEEVLRHSVKRLTALFERMIAAKMVSNESHIVLVNDGSNDQTWPIIKQLHFENKFVQGICLSRNVGHQIAILAGMMTVREWADAVVTIDADLQDDIECIPQMVQHFMDGNDIVYGVKAVRKADSLTKRMTAQMYYRFQSLMGDECVYNHADFRLMSRKALDILATYKEHNIYLRGLIPQFGLQSATVEDVIYERYAGSSKYTITKMMGLALNGITAFSVRPLYLIFNIGIVFLIIAFCIVMYVIYGLTLGKTVPGWASLILSVWLVGGFVMTSLV